MKGHIEAFFNLSILSERRYSIIIALIIFSLPLSTLLTNLFIILLIIIWLGDTHWKEKLGGLRSNPALLLFVTLFLLFCSGIFAVNDISSELKQIEKRLSLLLIPLVLVSVSSRINKKYTYRSIILATNILTLFTLGKALIILFTDGTIPTVGKEVSNLTLIHRPYLAYFCLISSVICFYYLISNKWLQIKAYYILSYLLSVSTIIILVSRTAIAILIIIHIYIIFKTLVKGRRTFWIFATVSTFVSIILIAGLLNYDRFTSRFDLLLKGKEEPRILIWNCSYKIFSSAGFDIFSGLGSPTITQKYLEDCYKEEFIKGTYWGWIYEHGYDYNTHNEFLNILLSFGFLGLFVFVWLLAYLFVKSWHSQDPIDQCFLIIFVLCCLTENFLARQYGIVSFSVFSSLILVEYSQNRSLKANGTT